MVAYAFSFWASIMIWLSHFISVFKICVAKRNYLLGYSLSVAERSFMMVPR
jgi:hypothetical protein